MRIPRLAQHHFSPLQWRMLTVAGLIAIIGAGFLFRLWLSPHPGFEFDMGVNQGWGRSAAELGLARSYVEQVNGNMLPNYAPFSIMLFWIAGLAQQTFFGFDDAPDIYRILIKLPAIFADLITALSFFFILKKWKGAKTGLIGALIYSFHPAVFHESAIWGQTDSIFTMFLATGAWAFVSKRPTIAGALFALALLTKMQAVALMPLFFVLYLRGGWRIFLRGILGGIAVTVPVLLPFALGKTLGTVIDVYHGSVGFYSMVSSAAYNFWWSLYGDEAGNLQDTQYLFGIMTFRSFGLMMFGLSYLYASVMLWKHLRVTGSTYAKLLPTVYMSGAFVALAFFLWNTQMHERYLFPFVALGLPMTFIDRRGALIYFFVSLLFYMNLIGWLPAGTIDKKLYAEFTTLDVFIAAAQVICYFEFVYYLWVYRTNNPVPVLKRSSPGFFKKIKRLIPRVKPS